MKISKYFNVLRKVKECSAGSIIPLTSALVLLVVVVVGSGIDLTSALNARSKMANALDASALKLAGKLSVAKLSDDEIQAGLEKMFTANLSRFDLKASALSQLEFEVDWTKGILDVWSDVSVRV